MRLKMRSKVLAMLCAAVPLWLHASTPARASDHANLEEGLPTEVEDAYPIEYKGRELQGQARYERTDDGENRFVLQPSLEFGFARNWQGKISVPFQFGSADRTGSGDIGLEAFYNFNTESLSTPAFAVSARADLPTGHDSHGVDTQFKFIASKTLGKGSLLQRLHLNLIYRHNASRRDEERGNRYAAIVGYSRRLGPDTILVTDFVHEQELERGKTANIIELGLRRQVTPLRTLSLGAGFGLGNDSPDFRLTAAFQQSF